MSWLIFRILQMNSDTSALEETHWFVLFSRCCSQWPHWSKNFSLICFSSPIYAYILRILPYTLLDFWYANCVRSSDRAVMAKILWKVSIFYLYSDWINPATWSKREFRELYYCSLRGLAKKKSSLAYNDTKKRELESNLTISETHVLNHPFMP